MRAELVIDALRMAARNYQLQPEAIFHSDHGSQYLSQAFAEAAARLDVRQSMGRVGSCFDNVAQVGRGTFLTIRTLEPLSP